MDETVVRAIARNALAEDLPDSTSNAIFGADDLAAAHFLVKADGVLAGMPFAHMVFRELDATLEFDTLADEGSSIRSGQIVARLRGKTTALLAGERTALNLLQRASGIATETQRYVDAVSGTNAKILDTRKTAPGLRALDKYAVRIAGGTNHRMSLHDLAMIKNNHVDCAGSILEAVERVRRADPDLPIMIEVRDIDELEEALRAGVRLVLLDNMSTRELTEAVILVRERSREQESVTTEASGGITLENVRAVAETGVDRISIGALTHSVRALDISMRVDAKEAQ